VSWHPQQTADNPFLFTMIGLLIGQVARLSRTSESILVDRSLTIGKEILINFPAEERLVKQLNRWGLSLFVMLCVLAIGSQSAQAQSESLRWNLQKGQAFTLKMNQDMKQKMQLPGLGAQEIPMTQEVDMTWSVVDSNDEGFTVEQVITRMQMSLKSPFMNIEYDSDDAESKDPTAKQMGEAMKNVIGQKFVQKMNRRGEVIDVKLPEGLEGNSQAANNPLSGDMLKQVTQQAALVFPEGPLSVGKSWDSNIDMNMNGMAMKTKNTYKYEGTEKVEGKELHKFSIKIDMSIEGGPQGIEVSVKDQDSGGVVYFDASEGRIVSATSKQKMTLEMDAQGQLIEQEMDGTVKLTVTPVKK
jgi:hypothetical protein